MWRDLAISLVTGLVLSAALYTQGTPLVQLPYWATGALVLGVLASWAERRAASRSIAFREIARFGDVLRIERANGSKISLRLSDGALVLDVPSGPRHGPSDEIELETQATYGDVARLWLTKEQPAELHGLQLQPTTPLAFVDGRLVTSEALRTLPPSPLPILVLHRTATGDERLTMIGLDGVRRWDLVFDAITIDRTREVFFTADRIVLRLGSSDAIETLAGRTKRPRGREGDALLALSCADGQTVWRAAL